MSEKPGETPNPLQDAKTQAAAGTGTLDANPAEPVQAATTSPVAAPVETTTAAVAEPVKKKKTGLIVGIIVAVLALAGAGVAAAILLAGGGNDPVVKAIEKVANGDMPQYVKMNGSFEVSSSDGTAAIKNMALKIDSDLNTKNTTNSVKAELSVELSSGKPLSFELEGVSTESGDLYFKIDGVSDILTQYIKMLGGATTTDDSAIASYYLSMIGDIVEELEGEWLKVSAEDLKTIMESMGTGNQSTCMLDLAESAKNGGTGLMEAYRKSPFISSTTEGVNVASKGSGPVYKVLIDKDAAKTFADNVKESDFVKKAKSCLQSTGNVTEVEDVEIGELPDLYVELDNDNNFTRIYTEKTIVNDCCPDGVDCYVDCSDTSTKMVIDFGFSYPSSLSIEEPSEAEDLMEVIEKIFSSLYTTYDE
ncbi:hypothetical protein IKF92_00895 [Candidatus Saccharibacteria bacterium]|nr:hypothetical protein [Candidatus Saccharibacteria bacterium]